MGSSVKLDLNTTALKWARENIGLEPKDLPKSLKDKVLDFESGAKQLTLIQANELARRYGVSVYFFQYPPKQTKFITEIPDFRELPKPEKKKYSSDLRLLIQRLKQRQDWLSGYSKEENQKPLSFIRSISLETSPQEASNKILKTFFQSKDTYINFREKFSKNQKENFLRSFVKRIGAYRIIALRCRGFDNEKKVDLSEARGFVLLDKYAPFIFINSADHPTAQIFTLMHELTHLFLGEEGVSGNLSKSNHDQVETFCNKVASRILLTDDELSKHCDNPSKENIIETSEKFFISRLSILLRLKEKGAIATTKFNKMWDEFSKEMKSIILKIKEKEQDGKGGNYYNTQISRTNGQFVKLVYDAYHSESITGSHASFLLNIKFKNMKKLYKQTIKTKKAINE